MNEIKLAVEQSNDVARDTNDEGEGAIRTLRDLEMVLVGGGDGPYGWP
ncbi:MAG TPA: hypothetical protein VEC19_14950 [Usitatibacter sp.]|nr:hypothetical protein [Usitatibacter sp.]